MADDPQQPITRDDIKRGFDDIATEIHGQVDDARPKLLTAAAVGGILFVVVAYLVGKRVGTTKSTVVEIRRI